MIGSISSFRSRLPFAFSLTTASSVLPLSDQLVTCFFGQFGEPLCRDTRGCVQKLTQHPDIEKASGSHEGNALSRSNHADDVSVSATFKLI
jgi:hypothetical protein